MEKVIASAAEDEDKQDELTTFLSVVLATAPVAVHTATEQETFTKIPCQIFNAEQSFGRSDISPPKSDSDRFFFAFYGFMNRMK